MSRAGTAVQMLERDVAAVPGVTGLPRRTRSGVLGLLDKAALMSVLA